MRLFVTRRRERGRLHRNRVRRVLRAVFELAGAPVRIADIAARVHRPGMEVIGAEDLQALLDHILPRYGGRTELGDDGVVLYHFDRISREGTAAAAAREGARERADLGAVIFDTGAPAVRSGGGEAESPPA
jgi:hypothetical protein